MAGNGRTQMEVYKELRKTLGLPCSNAYLKLLEPWKIDKLTEREQITVCRELGFSNSDYFTFKAEAVNA